MKVKGEPENQPYRTDRDEYFVRAKDGWISPLTRLEIEQHIQQQRFEKSPPLRSMRVRNFLSLFQVELSFKPLTVIIGPNASGKSNLLKALKFLYTGLLGDIGDWETLQKQSQDLVWFGLDEAEKSAASIALDLEFFFKETGTVFSPHYRVSFRPERNRLTARTESLGLTFQVPNEPERHFERKDGTVLIFDSVKRNAEPTERRFEEPERLFAREHSSRFRSSQLLLDFIKGWRFIDVDAERARSGSIAELEPQIVPSIEGDGRNLSAVLYALQKLDPLTFEEIVERLGHAISFIRNIEARHLPSLAGPGRAHFAFRENAFPNRTIAPASMSDGTIRLLAVLTALLGDPQASLICVEEPDHGLHPHLMLRLADTMRTVVMSRLVDEDASSPQIVVTTHNPDFLDCFDLSAENEYLQVYIADRDPQDGKTTFISATDAVFKPWLRRYRLGDAVRRGVFS
jgi:predicted ATPase